MALFALGALWLIVGTLVGGWGISGLVLGIGWHRRKRWLIWLGGIPFILLSLAGLLCLAFVAFNIARSIPRR